MNNPGRRVKYFRPRHRGDRALPGAAPHAPGKGTVKIACIFLFTVSNRDGRNDQSELYPSTVLAVSGDVGRGATQCSENQT